MPSARCCASEATAEESEFKLTATASPYDHPSLIALDVNTQHSPVVEVGVASIRHSIVHAGDPIRQVRGGASAAGARRRSPRQSRKTRRMAEEDPQRSREEHRACGQPRAGREVASGVGGRAASRSDPALGYLGYDWEMPEVFSQFDLVMMDLECFPDGRMTEISTSLRPHEMCWRPSGRSDRCTDAAVAWGYGAETSATALRVSSVPTLATSSRGQADAPPRAAVGNAARRLDVARSDPTLLALRARLLVFDAGRSLAGLAVWLGLAVWRFGDNRPGDLGVCVVVERFVSKGGAGRDDFERFARQVSPALLRSAFLLTRDRGHAEDLLQMTLFRVARRWEEIEGSPRAFAYRVLVNLSRDRRRNLGRRPIEAPSSAAPLDVAARDVSERVLERDV